jgi:hypothetical protein
MWGTWLWSRSVPLLALGQRCLVLVGQSGFWTDFHGSCIPHNCLFQSRSATPATLLLTLESAMGPAKESCPVEEGEGGALW